LEALTRGEGGQARSGSEVSLEAPPGKATSRGRREDALGSASHERVESQGCPHCAGHEVVGWGRSHGLLRFRCKSCGPTFDALTNTPMAHLRKKERWLDQARARIEGKSLAKTTQLCGVHPTTAFRWHHRFLRTPASDKPRMLRGIVEAGETFVLESRRARRASGAAGPGIRASTRTTSPSSPPAT
jgi:transposase-like protein